MQGDNEERCLRRRELLEQDLRGVVQRVGVVDEQHQWLASGPFSERNGGLSKSVETLRERRDTGRQQWGQSTERNGGRRTAGHNSLGGEAADVAEPNGFRRQSRLADPRLADEDDTGRVGTPEDACDSGELAFTPDQRPIRHLHSLRPSEKSASAANRTHLDEVRFGTLSLRPSLLLRRLHSGAPRPAIYTARRITTKGRRMAGPMTGVRVVELGVWVAGPAAGGVLADWGADVVKIEPPRGDPARSFQRMLGGDMPNNPVFELDNRSKRSIVIDLTVDEGQELALELLDGADVFVTNVRADALARVGLDPDTLLARNPRLVYGHISGYGLEGPDANRAAYDIAAFWARSGIAHLLKPVGGALPFQRGGMGDHSTGVQFAGAISAALFSRERTGLGQLVATSLLRQGVYTIGFDLNMVLGWGLHPSIGNRETMGNVSINNYTAGDGREFWIVGLEGDRHWPPLARCVGHPEWIADPRFATARDRATNAAELIVLLDVEFSTRPLDEWAAIFEQEIDMFWAPVNSPDDIINDPQLRHAGGLIEVPDEYGTTTMIASPADFHGTPWEARWIAPRLGEHTAEILAELGRTIEQIDALVATGAVAREQAT